MLNLEQNEKTMNSYILPIGIITEIFKISLTVQDANLSVHRNNEW